MTYKFKMNDIVTIDLVSIEVGLPRFTGKGKVKGAGSTIPGVGHLYIVECPSIYNDDYPFEYFICPESYLTKVN